MIHKKSREEIKIMRHAGNIVALVHQEMARVVEAGISTLELDRIAFDVIKKNKAIPTFLGYCGFPNSICTSINEQVVHGIPSKDVILKEGDIVSIFNGHEIAIKYIPKGKPLESNYNKRSKVRKKKELDVGVKV